MISQKVLTEVHEFDEVDAATGVVPRGHVLPADAYDPKLLATSIKFSEVCSFKQTPPWCSPGASTLPQMFADFELMRLAVDDDVMTKVTHLWQGNLMSFKHHVLVKKKVDKDRAGWFFPLFQVANSATLVWPAEEVFFKEGSVNHAYYVPSKAVTNIHELFILFVDHKMCVMKPFKWRSPLWQDSRDGRHVLLKRRSASLDEINGQDLETTRERSRQLASNRTDRKLVAFAPASTDDA